MKNFFKKIKLFIKYYDKIEEFIFLEKDTKPDIKIDNILPGTAQPNPFSVSNKEVVEEYKTPKDTSKPLEELVLIKQVQKTNTIKPIKEFKMPSDSYNNKCRGKIKYPYKEIANQTASELNNKDFQDLRLNLQIMNSYLCPFCKGYHVGHFSVKSENSFYTLYNLIEKSL